MDKEPTKASKMSPEELVALKSGLLADGWEVRRSDNGDEVYMPPSKDMVFACSKEGEFSWGWL
jgi:hypothetical protein